VDRFADVMERLQAACCRVVLALSKENVISVVGVEPLATGKRGLAQHGGGQREGVHVDDGRRAGRGVDLARERVVVLSAAPCSLTTAPISANQPSDVRTVRTVTEDLVATRLV
jgi:hypothetical protein